jgi:hypothetical protein
MDETELAHHVVASMLAIARENKPEDFRAYFIGGIVANVVGVLPADYWKEFIDVGPCGRPGCDCHVVSEKLMPGLIALREDHKLNAPPSGGN